MIPPLPVRGEQFTDQAGVSYVVVGRRWNDAKREMTVSFRLDPHATVEERPRGDGGRDAE